MNVLSLCLFGGYLLFCTLLWWWSSAQLMTVSALELGNWLSAPNFRVEVAAMIPVTAAHGVARTARTPLSYG